MYITKDGKTATFSDVTVLLGAVEAFLQLQQHLVVSVPKHATTVFQGVKGLFDKHRIQVMLTVDSDPAAIDYVIHSLIGGLTGAGAGAATSVGVLVAAAKIGQHIPYVGWVITAGALIGVAIGVTVGLTVTRMGLRVKFSPVNRELVEVEFLPASRAA
jgi:hypothetical protein